MTLETKEGSKPSQLIDAGRVTKKPLSRRFTPIDALILLMKSRTEGIIRAIARETQRRSPKKGSDGNFYGTEEDFKAAEERWSKQFDQKITKPEIILKK